MYTLANHALEVSILDPIADQQYFGPRYCTGGYIYRVIDNKLGDLMSGPTFPDKFNWFDGQGIPDAFHLSPLRENSATDTLGLILGIGLCDLAAREVKEYCTWEVTQTDGSITMRTEQSYQSYKVTLERTVTLPTRSDSSPTAHRRSRRAIPTC